MKIRDDIPEDVREALEAWMANYRTSGDDVSAAVASELVDTIRVPDPIQPPIPWEYIDEQWRWMAMDASERWHVYDHFPDPHVCAWGGEGQCQRLPCPLGADRPWDQTLIGRDE